MKYKKLFFTLIFCLVLNEVINAMAEEMKQDLQIDDFENICIQSQVFASSFNLFLLLQITSVICY